MTPAGFLSTACENVVQTAGYLLAYGYVLLLAPLAHVALVALGRAYRKGEAGRNGVAASLASAATDPLSRRSIESSLRAAANPRAAVALLAVSHALTVHCWILLGPLLGKDFLLSHVLGVLLFGIVAAGLARAMGIGAPRTGTRAPRPFLALGLLAALRNLALIVLGLALGGLVAAWGLSPWRWAPADLGTAGWQTQILNGGIGVALALSGVPPVANLFFGTYLWKTGLAQAGIVAFFCAAPAAPTRWRLYTRAFGRSGAVRLVVAVLVAALAAGLATAWLFGRTGVEIRYKLIPEQLWEVR